MNKPLFHRQNVENQADTYNDFYYDGQQFQNGVHYKALDYVPVSGFTPLSGTNWYTPKQIIGSPILNRNSADVTIQCVRCDNPQLTQTKYLRIEVISSQRNLFRVRFNPYATGFSDYDSKENNFGPITRNQLNWIQNQDQTPPAFSYESNVLTITLKDTILTFSADCVLTVLCRQTGQTLHSDGWVTPPGINSSSQPAGIVYVDEQYGSAVAAIKTLPRSNGTTTARYYGCGECQNYYETHDSEGNHSSSMEHTGQSMTFFNYDNYEMDQTELHPVNEESSEQGSEQSFIPQYTGAPFIIEYSPENAYAYGVLLDNTSQTYFNLGDQQYPGTNNPETTTNVDGVYYFGAQYPELDYYLIFPTRSNAEAGQGLIGSVLDNFTLLTGKENQDANALNLRGAMPPKYIFGFFQGVYGYTGLSQGEWPVESVVQGYQGPADSQDPTDTTIPLEGLAIDVDVQNNYEVFTTNGKFWEGGEVGQGKSVFEWAHDQNLVCQTNITNFIRNDQQGYKVYDTMQQHELYTKCSRFIEFSNSPSEGQPYEAILPYTGTTAVFPNFGLDDTPTWWGSNYWSQDQVDHPLLNIGLDFVWQDMTVPAMSPHIRGNAVNDQSYNNTPGCYDLTNGIFNWKTYHGQQLYPDPRFPGQSLPYIALRNFHAYMECKATYEKGLTVEGHYPIQFNRSYIISRGGYIGLAHFGGFWTGDNASGWKYMQIEVPKVLNMGLCGFPIVGADLGGFAPELDEEDYNHCQENLMTRWVQAGCLLPWFRDHYVNASEYPNNPNRYQQGKAFQELYKYNWNYTDEQTGYTRQYSYIMNDFVKLRTRLHHVLYDSMYQFCQTGLPPVKPTCLYDGGSSDTDAMKGFYLSQDSQFFIGDSYIMAAPAMEDQNCQYTKNYPATIYNHPVWLPNAKKWFPYDARFDGPCNPGNNFSYSEGSFGYYSGDGQTHGMTVPLQTLPLFIREGAIIPTRLTKDGSVKNIQQLDLDQEPFVFDIWPGSTQTSYQSYFDDSGKTKKAELNGKYSLLTLTQSTNTGNWVIGVKSDRNEYTLPEYLYIRLRAAIQGDISDSQGKTYTPCSSLQELYNSSGSACFFDDAKQEAWIQFSTQNLSELTITKKQTFNITELNQ